MIAFLAAAVPFGLFTAFPSCFWNFDGVACAMALELGDPSYLFHSDHLLYGFFGWLFWQPLGRVFPLFRALPALQLFSSLLSAIGLAGLGALLHEQTRRPVLSILMTWAVAVTAVVWVWSAEAQVYPLGFAALAWATYVLLRRSESRWKYPVVGLLHGMAILGHVLHGLWVVPACYWIAAHQPRSSEARSAALRSYLAPLAATVAIAYALVFLSVLWPAHHGATWFGNWLKGSGGVTLDRHWAWHWGGWSGPWQWARASVLMIWGAWWPYGHRRVSGWLWGVTIASMILAILPLARALWKTDDKVLRNFCLLWVGAYGLFLWTWEPLTLCYRMTDVIPAALLLTLAIPRRESAWAPLLWAGALFASTGLATLGTEILPMHRPELNSVYEQTIQLAKITPQKSLYLTEGGTPWIYLLYFAGRSTWNVDLMSTARLIPEVTRHKQWVPVFIHTSLLRDAAMQPWLAASHFRQVAPDLPWVQLL